MYVEAKPSVLLEMLRNRFIQRRVNILEAKLPTTTAAVVVLQPALVAAAEAQGISMELLQQLTPHDQALLVGAFTGQLLAT